MTISEQIREAALYLNSPFTGMPLRLLYACMAMKTSWQSMCGLPDTDLRTFMLLVAEALE